MISLPPSPPYWPMYPEPERSRLEAAYREQLRRHERWNTIEFGFAAAWVLIFVGFLVTAAVLGPLVVIHAFEAVVR